MPSPVTPAAGFAVSGAQRAVQTLTWLADHGYEDLARSAIVVITDKENVSERVDKSLIRDSLRGLCRRLIVVPYDSAVVDGDKITWRRCTRAPARLTWRSPQPSSTATSSTAGIGAPD